MYDENLYKNKEITKIIDDRSLIIFQKILKRRIQRLKLPIFK